MEDGHGHIVATTAELAALAAGFADGTPVAIDVEEIEPGHDPADVRGWAVVVRVEHVPLNEAGQLAGPGERIATGEANDKGERPLLFGEVLTLQSRKLATPGRIGPLARAADPCQRRVDAYEAIEREGEAGLYLMELLEAVTDLQNEVAGLADDKDRLLHPAARRHLASMRNALQAAQAAANHASRFGSVCELLRVEAAEQWADEIEDGQPCDQGNLHQMLVELPGTGYVELACPIHAKLAQERVPDAIVRPNPQV
ncbi:hypothetical protein [Nonomuraea sp. NPDC046570]|uniref:hypothetical protein n=1 Tax=Nonomuraea sp. NPDC046570 TaxID=3155255 RepID=UPI00341163A5